MWQRIGNKVKFFFSNSGSFLLKFLVLYLVNLKTSNCFIFLFNDVFCPLDAALRFFLDGGPKQWTFFHHETNNDPLCLTFWPTPTLPFCFRVLILCKSIFRNIGYEKYLALDKIYLPWIFQKAMKVCYMQF